MPGISAEPFGRTAVNADIGTRGIARVIAGNEGDHRAEFFRRAEPPGEGCGFAIGKFLFAGDSL